MFPHETITSPRRVLGARCSRYFLSLPALFLLFALAVFFSVSGYHIIGAAVFAGIITVVLFLCSDLAALAAPILFLSVFVTHCYDSFNTFIHFAWGAPLIIAALIYNITVYREKIRIGRTFPGMLAVSLALLLGGVGDIKPENYFSGTSLYYILGLGLGLTAVYLLIRSRFAAGDIYRLFGHISTVMYLVGLLAAINVFVCYKESILAGTFFSDFSISANIQPSNNLSTFLMFAMPFPVWFALKQNPLHILSLLLFYGSIVITGSRAGLIMGAVECIICLCFWARFGGQAARKVATVIGLSGVLVAGLLTYNFFYYNPTFEFVSDSEMRSRAIPIAIRSFLEHPIFGIGLKNDALAGLYAAKKGALPWFHMYIPQIIASMGSIGIAAYGYQLILRFTLIIRKKCTPLRMTLGISYIGVLLMSQFNPGEFCPIPYAIMAVAIFAMLEQLTDTERLVRRLAPEWS